METTHQHNPHVTLPRFIGITELRNNVRRVFDRLAKDQEPVVVIRESKPEAVILPYKDFESLVRDVPSPAGKALMTKILP